MPPLAPVPNCMRVTLKYQEQEDVDIINRFFLQYGTLGTPADFVTLANSIGAFWNTHLSPVTRNELSLVAVTVTGLASASDPEVTESAVHPGTAGAGTQASGVALIIKQKIARRYRGGHPRLYLPGTRSSELTDSQLWAPARAAAWLTAWEDFMTNIISGSPAGFGVVAPVNVSYFKGFTNFTFPSGRIRPIPTPRPGGPIKDLIIGYDVNPRPGSQRRRNLQGA